MKNNKGITLVALIITIVVLLILAAVTIRSVSGEGIIEYAQNASTSYNQAQQNETVILQTYMNQLNDAENSQKLIKFIVNYSSSSDQLEEANVECVAERGMTWKEWVESDYYNPKSRIVIINGADVEILDEYNVFWTLENVIKNANDPIIEGKKYGIIGV